MAFYPDEFKEYLRENVRIEEIIASYTGGAQLRGHHYVALCPFHSDTNPSLMINTDTRTWSCNSCGAGSRSHSVANASDIFGFVKGFLNVNLGMAIEAIAQFGNIPLPALSNEQADKYKMHGWYVEKTKAAQQRFQNNLMNEEGQKAYTYLVDRGFDDKMIAQFGLGLGDENDPEFTNTKGRITFPIYNKNNDIISFSGRTPFNKVILDKINEDRKVKMGANYKPIVKYLHRYPLTAKYDKRITEKYVQAHPYPTFKKTNYLYGQQLAAPYIRKWGQAIVVEGFTDVMRLHQHGLCNAVGSMSASLTDDQCLLLKSMGAKKVLIMRDGDLAGIQAMELDTERLKKFDILFEVVPLPAGDDPDSLGMRFSTINDEYARYVRSNTKLLSEWRIEYAFKKEENYLHEHYHEINNIRERRVSAVSKALSEEKDPVQKDLLKHQYADMLSVSIETLDLSIQKFI